VAQPLPTVVIMSSQPTTSYGACVVWVVLGYVVGGKLVSGTTQQCTINAKNIVLYTIQTLEHTVVASQLNAKGSTLHTGTYVVHNNYSGTQHLQRCTTHICIETFRLPERQVASTVLAL